LAKRRTDRVLPGKRNQYAGGKIDLSKRIAHFLKTGEKSVAASPKNEKSDSKFDWNSEKLSLQTVITDNYKNTQNVRDFFTGIIGRQFKFNVAFINWMKSHPGSTLADAAEEWKRIYEQKKTSVKESEIAPQFEYNTYIRAFLRENPQFKLKDAITCWKVKKSLKGHNRYEKSDLQFLLNQ
jgi:hypothetical protein